MAEHGTYPAKKKKEYIFAGFVTGSGKIAKASES
jgi:hypothetical protein